MSITCFIFPADTKLWEDPNSKIEYPKPDFRILKSDFRIKLKERFPHLVEGGILGTYELNSESEQGIGISVAVVDETYTTVYIKPYGVNLVEFILWYREYVPEKYELYFNCMSFSFDGLKLTSKTTADDIREFFSNG